jgi:hypothetical protein
VVFARSAALEKKPAGMVEDEHRERTVQPAAGLVGAEFLLGSGRIVVFVDENDAFHLRFLDQDDQPSHLSAIRRRRLYAATRGVTTANRK